MATLLKGDCLELMKGLPDKSVDCFVCDLPYGCLHAERKRDTSKWYDSSGQARGSCAWDVKIDLTAFWEQVKRLCKDDHTPVLMFCNTRFGIDLINSNPKWFRYDLVWDKGHGVSFLSANKMPMKSHEMIYVFSKAGSYYKRIDVKTERPSWTIDRSKETTAISTQYGVKSHKTDGIEKGGAGGMRCPLSVIPVGGKLARNGHPTQKPEELYEWLLTRYCPAGGTMLDPTAGSFNSVFVARRLGLKAIGMEMDKGFYYRALVRLLNFPSARADTPSADNVVTHV